MDKQKPDVKTDDEISYKTFSCIIYFFMVLVFLLVITLGKENERKIENFRNAESGMIGENIHFTKNEAYMDKAINLENELSQLNNNIRRSLVSSYEDEQKNEELIGLNRSLIIVLAKDILNWEDVPSEYQKHYELLIRYAELHSELADEQVRLLDVKISDDSFSIDEMESAIVDIVHTHNMNTEQLKKDMSIEFESAMSNSPDKVGDAQ